MSRDKIFGCSVFGFEDTIFSCGRLYKNDTFSLANAVLPSTPLGNIMVGKESEEERVNTGFIWPPDARVEPGKPLRRTPIPCLWKLLVEAEDTPIYWKIEEGISFPLPRIIANHIVYCLKQAGYNNSISHHVIVAIPDELDEFGQESLIRALKNDIRNIHLIWRPVAAALYWLNHVQEYLLEPEPEDSLIVIYLGADAFEFVRFRLRQRTHQGKNFIIPLRDRPYHPVRLAGFDWVASAIEQIYGPFQSRLHEFWQIFSNFPEIWHAIVGRKWKSLELPRIWSKEEQYILWEPDHGLFNKVLNVKPGISSVLSDILAASCPLKRSVSENLAYNWNDFLEKHVKDILNIVPENHLRGVMICGPLAPRNKPPWIVTLESLLRKRGFLSEIVTKPTVNALYIADDNNEPVSEGAKIFGERILKNEPTYLDTLPPLFILAINKGSYDWIPLVETTECEGGKEYFHKIVGKFLLKGSARSLDVYLQKKYENLNGNFSQEKSKTPYRRATFKFPASPLTDTVLDLEVKMRPASGLAQVEIIPERREFLRGRQVFLDYSTMQTVDKLPELKRGWPDVKVKVMFVPLNNKYFNNTLIKEFLTISCLPTRPYINLLDKIKKEIFKKIIQIKTEKDLENENMQLIALNEQSNINSGQENLNQLIDKLDKDFCYLIGYRDSIRNDSIYRVLVCGTWLWDMTPESIRDYIRKLLRQNYQGHYNRYWNRAVEGGSRSFINIDDYSLLFTAIEGRLKNNNLMGREKFPIQASRAIYRLLYVRQDAEQGLTREQAFLFAQEAVNIMILEAEKSNFRNKFFQAVQLFIFLLRFRKKDSTFLDPDNPHDKKLFDKALSCLDKANSFFRENRGHDADKAISLIEGIKAYMYYEGHDDIIHVLNEFAGKKI